MPRGHVLPDGDRITLLRGEADLTQWQLAAEAGYGLRTIGKIEDGQPTSAGTLAAVATVLARRLKRPVGLGDLLRRPESSSCCQRCAAQAPCQVQEAVKLLDLRGWRPAARNGHPGPSRVILEDFYRFRRVAPDVRTLHFHYATPGPRIEGRCLSHPDGAHWQSLGAGRDPAMKCTYRMQVRLPEAAVEGVEVSNRLEYVDAFPDERAEWFPAPVVFPTESLTILALFAEDRPCRSVRGVYRHHPAEPPADAPKQPALLVAGRVVAWPIAAPLPGATYQLEWQW